MGGYFQKPQFFQQLKQRTKTEPRFLPTLDDIQQEQRELLVWLKSGYKRAHAEGRRSQQVSESSALFARVIKHLFLRSASTPANVPVGFILGNAFCPQPTPANDFPSTICSPDVPEALVLHTR